MYQKDKIKGEDRKAQNLHHFKQNQRLCTVTSPRRNVICTNCKNLTNEGQIEVKREPMAYTMQSTLFNCSNTAALGEGKTYSKKRKRSFQL